MARRQGSIPKAALTLLLLASLGPLVATQQEAPSSARLSDRLLKQYLTNEQLAAWGDELVAKCPAIARKFSIGKSVNGVDLWGIELSDKPGVAEPEPNFKYLANMHGNEPSGRVLLPMLAEWLCANNGRDARATRLVHDAHVFLVPTMNPDGYAARTRENANGADLNRNFPDPIAAGKGADLRRPLASAEPETVAIMRWSLSRPFAGSANLHEGAVVANYPLDGYADMSQDIKGARNPSPDDATFVFLAKQYASHHATMAKSKEFPSGIVNGAQWYPVYNGMQDWNYKAAGCMSITLELSDEKWRPEKDLPVLWAENRDALVAYALTASLGGVRGNVTDAASGAPLQAVMRARPAAAAAGGGEDGGGGGGGTDAVPFYASKEFGFYARPLAPGRYVVSAVIDGYAAAESEVTVPPGGAGVVQNLQLRRLAPPPGAAGAAAALPPQRNGDAGDAKARRTISARILLLHGLVFVVIGAASACQGSGAIQALAAVSRHRRAGSASRFEV